VSLIEVIICSDLGCSSD